MTAGDWRHNAACATRQELDWFDIDCNLQACLNVCRQCGVTDQCLDEAIRLEADDGVWAGVWGYRLLKAKQRRQGGG